MRFYLGTYSFIEYFKDAIGPFQLFRMSMIISLKLLLSYLAVCKSSSAEFNENFVS